MIIMIGTGDNKGRDYGYKKNMRYELLEIGIKVNLRMISKTHGDRRSERYDTESENRDV